MQQQKSVDIYETLPVKKHSGQFVGFEVPEKSTVDDSFDRFTYATLKLKVDNL